jgi:hypothetical protein
MPHPNKKNQLLPEVKRLHYGEGVTLRAISESLGVHEVTLSKWLKSEGLTPNRHGYKQNQVVRAAKAGETKERRSCRQCGKEFDDYAYRNRAFCSRDCTTVWLRENAADTKFRRWCPCGEEILENVYERKYCSPEHRRLYGKKRQANPANYVTFNCLNCDKEVTRPKNYGGSQVQKYCSNECSAKHNRTKQHIVVEDAMVLDSPYEALFYGLMRLWKVPCERADRSTAVQVYDDGWYCPDFYLPDEQTWVEIKGFEDDDDRIRYEAWRKAGAGRKLVVLGRDELEQIRRTNGVSPTASGKLALMTLRAMERLQAHPIGR